MFHWWDTWIFAFTRTSHIHQPKQTSSMCPRSISVSCQSSVKTAGEAVLYPACTFCEDMKVYSHRSTPTFKWQKSQSSALPPALPLRCFFAGSRLKRNIFHGEEATSCLLRCWFLLRRAGIICIFNVMGCNEQSLSVLVLHFFSTDSSPPLCVA